MDKLTYLVTLVWIIVMEACNLGFALKSDWYEKYSIRSFLCTLVPVLHTALAITIWSDGE